MGELHQSLHGILVSCLPTNDHFASGSGNFCEACYEYNTFFTFPSFFAANKNIGIPLEIQSAPIPG